jgi:YidC/Oxa1 family membrane protein insertase
VAIWNQFVDLIAAGLNILANYSGSAGLSIIIFTILIKTVLLPFTIKSVRSTSSMQAMQPKIKELQKKHAGDKAKIQAEQMKLYQEHGVNPVSGCLPMLIQIPIFFGLYYAIINLSRHGGGLWTQSFLWLPSMAEADPYHILPIVAGIFQFIQVKMTRPAGVKSGDSTQQMMQTASTFMPFTVVAIGWVFPSGPVLYWAVSALYSVVQQWFITGWGSLLEWFSFLPDLPEHRRLGYETPEKRAARIAAAKNKGGLTGLLNRQFANQAGQGSAGKPEAKGTQERPPEQPDGKQTSGKTPPRSDLVPRKSRSQKRKQRREPGS